MTDTTSPTIHSTPSTLLGAGVGAAIGYGLATWDKMRGFSIAKRQGYTILSTLGGAVVGGIIGRYSSSTPNPNYVGPTPLPPSPTPPPLQQVSGGGTTLTVSPGLSVQTIPLEPQDQVVIRLPTAGAQWQSMDGAPVADRTSPIVFTFLGPISHTLVWFDERNQQYVNTYFFVVNPSTPTTNA